MDIEEDKDKAEQFKNDGNSAYKRKEFASAVELYTKAIMYCRSEPNYYANRAACYLAMEKYQLCISDSNRALDIDPNFTKVLRRKALSQMQLLQFDDAIANLTKGLSIDSSDENMRKDLGDCSRLKSQYTKMEENFKDDKMEDALTQLNIIIQTIPKNATLLVKKIIILAMKGSSDSAKQLLIQVQNMDDVQKDIHYLQGICELYNGNTDKAKTFFKQGMVMDPDNKKCREMLQKAKQLEELKEKGNQAIKDSNYDKSIQIYDQALLVDPKNRKLNSIILSNRALAYVKKKEYKKALDDVNLSISFNEQYFRAYLRRADIRMKMGDFDKALIDYQKVKELDPSQNVDSLINEARMQEKKAKKKDYYKILGVERTATDKEITKAYRKLALKWHPDKNQDNKEEADKIFRNINEAYQVLSDPKKKQMFDQGADPNDQESGGMPADFNPNDIFNMFFGGGGPGASRGGSSAGQGGFPGGFGGFPGFGSFGSGGGFGQGGFGQGGFGQGGGNQGFNFRFG